MTKLELQNEILKQFKKRLRREYGKWTDMYEFTCKKFAEFNAGDLMKLSFATDFTVITIIFDCCLNVSISVNGCSMNARVARVFMDVADECVNYVEWLLSKDRIHRITFEGRDW